MLEKEKVIVIGGPTASGKTALSIELAKKINGEIVSADSMQIYRKMDIGTAKPSEDEMQGIKHYMIDIVNPDERFSVADYVTKAKEAIEEILSKGKVPIVIGGTGLYIESLIYEISFLEIETDLEYREELEKISVEKGLSYLYEKALKIDPYSIEKISKNDKKRIFRILEIYHQTGKTKSQIDKESRKEPQYDYRLFAIDMDREVLYNRIDKRVDIMIENGLINEVKSIVDKYKTFPTAMQGLGYKEVVEYLNNETAYEDMIEKIKKESRHYAKRQLTWFRKYKNIIWLNGLEDIDKNIEIIEENYKK